jgi:glutamate racemase
MRTAPGPIGLFDSGIGGATVLAALHQHMPHDDLVLLSDQARCPYGPRPAAELVRIALANTRWLLAQDARLIVVACNTASAAALGTLRSTFPGVPFVGMVPAVKPAVRASRRQAIGVLATPTTIAGTLLRDVIAQWAGDARVIAQACPGLVEQIEAGELDTPATVALLTQHLAPLRDAGVDTIVLGCTHYPLVAPTIVQLMGAGVSIIDAAPAVARQVARIAASHSTAPGHGSIRYVTTGDQRGYRQLIERCGLPPGQIERIAPLDINPQPDAMINAHRSE